LVLEANQIRKSQFRPLQESSKKCTNCIENGDFENAITKGHNNLDIGE
jgi:hypothetical protein